jgi:hypothetical protein
MAENHFAFFFEGDPHVELVKTDVFIAVAGSSMTCVRGKTAGAYRSYGSFQWTTGVRGVCAAFMRFKIYGATTLPDVCLIGGKNSLAASLDYAITKCPGWISGMFGSSSMGTPVIKRLFRVTNTNRKRPGPVAISVNGNIVVPDNVRFYKNNRLLTDGAEVYDLLAEVEQQQVAREHSEKEALAASNAA